MTKIEVKDAIDLGIQEMEQVSKDSFLAGIAASIEAIKQADSREIGIASLQEFMEGRDG